ncbi:MAG: hypothetical protein RRY79_06675 [Clostridia bacterium]
MGGVKPKYYSQMGTQYFEDIRAVEQAFELKKELYNRQQFLKALV